MNRKPLRVWTLNLDTSHLQRRVVADVLVPVGSGDRVRPVDAITVFCAIEIDKSAAAIGRMQLHDMNFRPADFVRHADADRFGMIATPLGVAGGEDHHIAAVPAFLEVRAPEPFEVASDRRALARWRDHLKQNTVDGVENILEAVGADVCYGWAPETRGTRLDVEAS